MSRSDSFGATESPRVNRYGFSVCIQVVANFIELSLDRLKSLDIDFRMIPSIFGQRMVKKLECAEHA
jgi:hypothetical protein